MKSLLQHNSLFRIRYSLFIALYSLLIFAIFSLFLAAGATAQSSMSNDKFIIRLPNLNSFSGKPTNPQYKLGITGGQIAPGLYSGPNYKARAGFQYIKSVIPFSFSISGQFIDFGPITPGEPVIRTSDIIVTNGSAYGYSVIASENHPLKANTSGFTIPDTTCDSGTCTESTAAAWAHLTTFGFGYRCDNITGTSCSLAFSQQSYYKQFASTESAELAKPIMGGNAIGTARTKITYKVNISATQTAGQYQNLINLIAIPSI